MNTMNTYHVFPDGEKIPEHHYIPALMDFEEAILSVLLSGEEYETFTVFDRPERRIYAAAAFTEEGAIKDYIDRIYGKVGIYYKGMYMGDEWMSEFIAIKPAKDEWEILED